MRPGLGGVWRGEGKQWGGGGDSLVNAQVVLEGPDRAEVIGAGRDNDGGTLFARGLGPGDVKACRARSISV